MKIKNTHVALAVAMMTTVLSVQAQQQPSVEIYGLVGQSYTSKNNQTAAGVTSSTMATNSLAVSHLGFRGREDLGDGLSAVFRFETALALETGSAGKANGSILFDRQAYVGLSSAKLGTVTLGRQFHAATDRAIRSLDVYNFAPANAHIVPLALFGVNRFNGNDNRVNKSIKYRLDQPSGLQAGLSFGFGDTAGTETSKGSSYSADLGYIGSNYNVGASFVSFNGLATQTNSTVTPKHEVTSIGGSMTFGAFKPYLSYYSSTLDNATTAGLKAQTNKITALGLAWTASPSVVVRGAYYMDKGTDLNNVAGRNGNKDTLVLSADYSFSKRTTLNAVVANNSLSSGYLQEVFYTSALGRNPSATSVQFWGVGINHAF